ncbi:MAG TPA: hypothetical protein P5307_20260, partial [Pirellulaceae bacterium]|nr:hypothetical protein [Pirellulaceae bacterium]
AASKSLSGDRQPVTRIQAGAIKSQYKPLCDQVFSASVEAPPKRIRRVREFHRRDVCDNYVTRLDRSRTLQVNWPTLALFVAY